MKKHRSLPARQDTRITSQFIPQDGSIVISVARGWTGAGEVLYRIDAEKLAGAIEDRKELAVIVNNLGLLVLAQLCGFNLADTLEAMPKALAQWAHIDVKALLRDDGIDAALAIAQKTVHGAHGCQCEAQDPAKGEVCDCTCVCIGGPGQTICANLGCSLCQADQLKVDDVQEELR